MNRQAMIRRLLYLRNWECINIFLLPICLYICLALTNIQNWQPYVFGMFLICIIVAEGAFYWHLKLQTIYKNKPPLPPYFHRVFSLFKRVNMALLLIYPILLILGQTTSFISFRFSFWSNAIFIFAILEQINYYHYQLSHDSLNDIRFLIRHKKIRRSLLYVDLQKSKNRPLTQVAR